MLVTRIALFLGFAAAAHAELACPVRLDASTKAAYAKDGWIIEQVIASGRLQHASLFNSDGKREYELAPDDNRTTGANIVQQWKADDYRKLELYIRCDYGTAGRMRIKVPAGLKICEQKLTGWDPKKGQATGVQMACR